MFDITENSTGSKESLKNQIKLPFQVFYVGSAISIRLNRGSLKDLCLQFSVGIDNIKC